MLRALVFLTLPIVAGEELDAEKIRLARTAMEAKIRVGDLLLQQGDVKGAMRAYEAALEIFETASREAAAPPSGPAAGPEAARPGRRKEGAVAALEAEAAIRRGLEWLAKHQSETGEWAAEGFPALDPADDRCDGAGQALYDPGVTGLALLAFLGAGHTDRDGAGSGPFAGTVRNGLRYLLSIQDGEGVFGPRTSMHFIYNHAFATLAICEAFGATQNPRYRKPAQDAANWLQMARNPYLAWRYQPRGGENDTSVTGLCTMALRAAKVAGLEVEPEAFAGALAWVEKMTDPASGAVGYIARGGASARAEGMQDRFPAEKTEAMTAMGILTRFLCGQTGREPEIALGAARCAAKPPSWNAADGSIDMYYWYLGTLALHQVGGEPYRQWSGAACEAILRGQRSDGSAAGSWDPVDPWGRFGGRVYATATMTLSLEVLQRHAAAAR